MDGNQKFDKLPLLRKVFKGLEESELQAVADLSEIRSYPAEHVLCLEGALEDIFYIIASGEIVVTKKISEEAGERVLRHGGAGDLVGEMALIQQAPRSATVSTTSACTVLEMRKANFEQALSRFPRMAIDIMGVTIDRIRANDHIAMEDLRRTNEILRQLDRNKLEFIQVTAHELRTPLTVLKGYVSVLNSFPDVKANSAVEEVLMGIANGADRMHGVVNLMLDVTRFDGDRSKLHPTPTLMKPLVGDVVKEFKDALVERKITVIEDYAEDIPIINADPVMVQKAVYNIVINAIKYTPDGSQIEIELHPIQMEGDIPGVELVVKDNGIGLDKEHHELVFEKFYQVGSVAVHSSGKTNFKGGGPGLGLAIVSGVTRSHGGAVRVESEGHDEETFPGCAFYLQLPVDPDSVK